MKLDDSDFKAARDLALKLLSRRQHCRGELERKLRQRRYPLLVVQRVVDDLADRHLIDDETFALERALHLRARRGWGPRRIQTDLAGRGVDAKIITRAIDGAELECPSEEALSRVISSWLQRHGEPKSRSRLKKLFDHCYRQGFSSDLIRDSLEPFWSRTRQSPAGPGDRRFP